MKMKHCQMGQIIVAFEDFLAFYLHKLSNKSELLSLVHLAKANLEINKNLFVKRIMYAQHDK